MTAEQAQALFNLADTPDACRSILSELYLHAESCAAECDEAGDIAGANDWSEIRKSLAAYWSAPVDFEQYREESWGSDPEDYA